MSRNSHRCSFSSLNFIVSLVWPLSLCNIYSIARQVERAYKFRALGVSISLCLEVENSVHPLGPHLVKILKIPYPVDLENTVLSTFPDTHNHLWGPILQSPTLFLNKEANINLSQTFKRIHWVNQESLCAARKKTLKTVVEVIVEEFLWNAILHLWKQ